MEQIKGIVGLVNSLSPAPMAVIFMALVLAIILALVLAIILSLKM